MRELLLLVVHLIETVSKLLRPGGVRAVAAESLLLKQQIIIGNRSRRRAPNLISLDRFVLAILTLFIKPRRIPKLSAIIKSSTLLKLHKALVDRKHRILFSSTGHRRTRGPKGPSPALIAAIVEMKARNPKFVASALLSRSLRPSASRSTRMSFGASWQSTTGPVTVIHVALPG
jgi:hypothetical protein